MKSFDKRSSVFGFVSDVSVYGGGMILARFLGLAITPILTRLFSPADYGQIDALQSGASIVIAVISMSMESGLMRFFNDLDCQERKSLLYTHLLVVLSLGAAIVVLLLPFSDIIASMFFGKKELGVAVSVTYGVIFSSFVYQHVITVLRTIRAPRLAVLFSLATAVAQFVCVLVFVLEMKYGLAGVLGGRFLAEIVMSLLVLAVIRNQYSGRFSVFWLKKLIRFGAPLMPETLFGIVIGYFGKFFLMSSHGVASMGMFVVGQKVSLLIVMISGAMKSAWLPYAFSISSQAESKEIFAHIFSVYLKIMAIFVVGLALFAHEITAIIAPSGYSAAALIGVLLGFAASLQGGVYIVNVGLLLAEKTRYYLLASLGCALVTVAAGFMLIPRLGLVGSAVVQVIAQLFMVVTVYNLSQKFHKINYKPLHLFVYVFGVSTIVVMLAYFPFLNSLPMKLALSGALVVGAWFAMRKEVMMFAPRFLSFRKGAS